ncbi:S9 family peptidase [Prevotella sp. E2-28]|uniref:S9 family peptidase n=1 Tax=Prevotella sp. E2-28 TaxID=2913620 RepID=UPI001EDBD9F2|nr:S9 family peptidase [Prevotella sp. E2-28]UKK52840.1 S9 family peptidase [Prevotella sp. E2-28]
MNKLLAIGTAALLLTACGTQKENNEVNIPKQTIQLENDQMTPEALWAMSRISGYQASPDGQHIVFQMGYYSVEENKSHQVLWMMNADGSEQKQLTTDADNETDAQWLDNETIAFIKGGEVWQMHLDGDGRKQMSDTEGKVEGFMFSPDRSKVIVLQSIPFNEIIKEKPADLPKSTGRVVTDLMYRHWDHYVESIQHPFVYEVESGKLKVEGFDILEGEPYECPMEPFGGMEQLAWSMDSKFIAFTCRCKTGLSYSVSTDSDIFLYDVESKSLDTTKNLCKYNQEWGVVSDGTVPYEIDNLLDPTKSLKNQFVNTNMKDMNVGYDTNPKFSPDGRYVAWLSMERDGYEADRNRLCVYDLKENTKTYVTECFDSNVDDFCWAPDSRTIYYIGVWHATENLYSTNLQGEVKQLTNDWADFGSLQMLNGKQLLMERHSYVAPADLYVVNPGDSINNTKLTQITEVNKEILDQLGKPSIEQYWVKTTDGKEMLTWVILPPHFDKTKKYPTLLFCEGGPQSPVSQFWSYRWNFFIMASQGYVVVAPNRRGLPGFGQEWLEAVSGDWTGQCMNDYLSAIDFACDSLSYIDRDKLGAVGASFGGFSVYYLAGHHNKRFKCFIAHDGAFNLEAMYTETEENWFSNWEYDDAYWNKDMTARAKKTYENSPHRFVDKWDTPILCIHGEKDYRINATQGMSAFNAARMRGIEAELLIFPDENHWVLKPQNGILWQRTYFEWLDRWLKK